MSLNIKLKAIVTSKIELFGKEIKGLEELLISTLFLNFCDKNID